jgi:hypothetical protein
MVSRACSAAPFPAWEHGPNGPKAAAPNNACSILLKPLATRFYSPYHELPKAV